MWGLAKHRPEHQLSSPQNSTEQKAPLVLLVAAGLGARKLRRGWNSVATRCTKVSTPCTGSLHCAPIQGTCRAIVPAAPPMPTPPSILGERVGLALSNHYYNIAGAFPHEHPLRYSSPTLAPSHSQTQSSRALPPQAGPHLPSHRGAAGVEENRGLCASAGGHTASVYLASAART